MTKDDPREDFRRACRSVDRIGAALQVIAVLVLIGGIATGVVTGAIDTAAVAIITAIVLYALGAVFDWFNRAGLFIIDSADRDRPT